MSDPFKRNLTWVTPALIVGGIVVNGAGGWLIARLDLPLYLDTVGTIFVAATAGPLAGAVTGLVTNLILGLVSPGYAPYWLVPILIGLAAGLFANAGWFKKWWKAALVGVAVSVIASVASTLITALVYGGVEFNLSYFLFEEPLDKVLSALLVLAAARLLPASMRKLLPRPENVAPEPG